MKDSYIDRANEILSLAEDKMISEEDLTEGIADIAQQYPDKVEEVSKIMNEIGFLNTDKIESKTSAASLGEIKKRIMGLPGPLAISLAALLTFAAPSNTAWAKDLSKQVSQRVVQNNLSKKTYSVISGDNFEKIAKKFGISVKELQSANPGVDSKKLQIGQKLNIPEKSKDAEYRSKSFGTYIVKPGDTLSKIAKNLGVSLNHLKELNDFSDEQANSLKVKQEIKTLDIDRLARAFIYVETFDIPESKKDTAIGDKNEALGCLQFHEALFKEGAAKAGISVEVKEPGEGEWWKDDDRTNRLKCYKAFKGVCEKYKPNSVEEMLKKAHWNPKANVKKYQDAYNNDLGKGIKLK